MAKEAVTMHVEGERAGPVDGSDMRPRACFFPQQMIACAHAFGNSHHSSQLMLGLAEVRGSGWHRITRHSFYMCACTAPLHAATVFVSVGQDTGHCGLSSCLGTGVVMVCGSAGEAASAPTPPTVGRAAWCLVQRAVH